MIHACHLACLEVTVNDMHGSILPPSIHPSIRLFIYLFMNMYVKLTLGSTSILQLPSGGISDNSNSPSTAVSPSLPVDAPVISSILFPFGSYCFTIIALLLFTTSVIDSFIQLCPK